MASLPDRIGRYDLVGLLATGGMAEILLGRVRGPSGFERPVVIKRVLSHLARVQTFIDMFLDEARILASIRHPNVVQVQELGREGEDLFLVLEFLEGESLGSVVRRLGKQNRRLPHALSAFVVAEACAGLHAAHELVDSEGRPLDLVHRDVSPHNIFITYTGQVKVIDFGIAQAARRLAHTEPGHVKGKFAYMSPEQCLGTALDRRSAAARPSSCAWPREPRGATACLGRPVRYQASPWARVRNTMHEEAVRHAVAKRSRKAGRVASRSLEPAPTTKSFR